MDATTDVKVNIALCHLQGTCVSFHLKFLIFNNIIIIIPGPKPVLHGKVNSQRLGSSLLRLHHTMVWERMSACQTTPCLTSLEFGRVQTLVFLGKRHFGRGGKPWVCEPLVKKLRPTCPFRNARSPIV